MVKKQIWTVPSLTKLTPYTSKLVRTHEVVNMCWPNLLILPGLLSHPAADPVCWNRPFPSFLVPLFQSESKCETIKNFILWKWNCMQNSFSYERCHTYLWTCFETEAQENLEMAFSSPVVVRVSFLVWKFSSSVPSPSFVSLVITDCFAFLLVMHQPFQQGSSVLHWP